MRLIITSLEYNFKRIARKEVMFTIYSKEGGRGQVLGIASTLEDAHKIAEEV